MDPEDDNMHYIVKENNCGTRKRTVYTRDKVFQE
jgi:hypothetical protein